MTAGLWNLLLFGVVCLPVLLFPILLVVRRRKRRLPAPPKKTS